MVTKSPLLALVLVVPFFLSSCGGGGTASSDTVINGISVPPEPDPTTNNATALGVDSNSNGVRDDVERKIASGFPQEKFQEQMRFAKLITAEALNLQLDSADLELSKGISCGKYNDAGELSDAGELKDVLDLLDENSLFLKERIKNTTFVVLEPIDCAGVK